MALHPNKNGEIREASRRGRYEVPGSSVHSFQSRLSFGLLPKAFCESRYHRWWICCQSHFHLCQRTSNDLVLLRSTRPPSVTFESPRSLCSRDVRTENRTDSTISGFIASGLTRLKLHEGHLTGCSRAIDKRIVQRRNCSSAWRNEGVAVWSRCVFLLCSLSFSLYLILCPILTFVAMDEQHSRSQRKFGAAPYCTTTFLNNNHLICQMNHVDLEQASKSDVTTKAGTLAKSKAKISHVEGMKAIVAAFKDSETQLQHFCTDQSADGMADAEVYFRPLWDFRPCYDIWHKVKEFQSLWKSFCMRRSCPRGMLFMYLWIFDYLLYSSSRLFVIYLLFLTD